MATPVEHLQAVGDAGHTTAQVGGGITILGWVTSSQGGVAVGIVIGIVGLAIQWYYRRKQNQREQDLYQLQRSLLLSGNAARAELIEEAAND